MRILLLFISISFCCLACKESKPPCSKPQYYTYLAMPSYEGAYDHYVHFMCCTSTCLTLENLYRVAVRYLDEVQVDKPITSVRIVDDPEGLAIDTDYWDDAAVNEHTLFSLYLDKPYPTSTSTYIYAIDYRDSVSGLRSFSFPTKMKIGAKIDLQQAIERR